MSTIHHSTGAGEPSASVTRAARAIRVGLGMVEAALVVFIVAGRRLGALHRVLRAHQVDGDPVLEHAFLQGNQRVDRQDKAVGELHLHSLIGLLH